MYQAGKEGFAPVLGTRPATEGACMGRPQSS
jgi:hypothetical protein